MLQAADSGQGSVVLRPLSSRWTSAVSRSAEIKQAVAEAVQVRRYWNVCNDMKSYRHAVTDTISSSGCQQRP